MNSYRPPASKPPAVGAHDFLRGAITKLPKEPTALNSEAAALNEAHQVSATFGTSQQEQMAKQQMNAVNGQMTLPQNRGAQMPALEVDVPTPSLSKGQEFLRQKMQSGGAHTPDERIAIAGLQSRLPVR
jgi:hypothetical protein